MPMPIIMPTPMTRWVGSMISAEKFRDFPFPFCLFRTSLISIAYPDKKVKSKGTAPGAKILPFSHFSLASFPTK